MKKGLLVLALVSLSVLASLIALYVYFVLLLPGILPLLHATLVASSTGVLLSLVCVDVVHALVDSVLLRGDMLSSMLRGFETCG
ncbi:MAG: hypothetical protein ACPLQS_05135 [Desulfurococcaceae archaeon]